MSLSLLWMILHVIQNSLNIITLLWNVSHIFFFFRLSSRNRGLPGASGGEPHSRSPPAHVPWSGRSRGGSHRGVFHRCGSLRLGLRAQSGGSFAALLWRPFPPGLRAAGGAGSVALVSAVRRVRPRHLSGFGAVRRSPGSACRAHLPCLAARPRLPPGAALGRGGHQHNRPHSAQPWVQTRPAEDELLPALPGSDRQQALHGLLPQCGARLSRQPGRSGRPLEGVCALVRDALHPHAWGAGSGASASGSSRAGEGRGGPRAEEHAATFCTGTRDICEGVWWTGLVIKKM